ncbi:unnamed protein product [Prorocentrum cordatum]|uniref:Uncharacterized protein n=1 Tax=Prorocentrum cordatum TaxID=2364126 RepID=A0ABN9SB63_9DINO|nr:unnamed protein product [Polarella glacialis]
METHARLESRASRCRTSGGMLPRVGPPEALAARRGGEHLVLWPRESKGRAPRALPGWGEQRSQQRERCWPPPLGTVAPGGNRGLSSPQARGLRSTGGVPFQFGHFGSSRDCPRHPVL